MNKAYSKKQDLIQKIRQVSGESIENFEITDNNRIYIDHKADAVKKIACTLRDEGARYLVGTASDTIDQDNCLSMIHSFAFDKEEFVVNMRTKVNADNPVMDSITPDIFGAGWSEREFQDLLGMEFTGHPNPKRLILADDWPEGIYPLRKEVPYNLVPPGAEDVAFQLDNPPEGTSVIPVGPFHSSLHEPEHFAVYVDGETIKGCEYRGFMTHRGIEKLCQTQVTYNEIPYIAERICGICGSVHATAYSQSVEEAAGIEIPRRAEYLRTIMLEIERLHSHLLWLGVAGHLIGYDTVFMHAWRVREDIMWLCEKITGNRKTYGMIIIGGTRQDIDDDLQGDILKSLDKVEKEVMALHKAIEKDSIVHKRTVDVGWISKKTALDWSLVGPVARARGVDIDVRRDHPYAAYDDMLFDVPVLEGGDVWSTLVIRILEMYESVSIIRQCLKRMPDGPILTETDEKLPAFKHGISMVEAPRGESVHYMITGEEPRPERWRVRAPTYPNLQAVPDMLLNNEFADFPIIVGSIDPCFSCTDRVIKVDMKNAHKGSGSTSGATILTNKDLENMSRNKGK
jgi:Ni,Fe-hydrogenase III large subunit/Ni,Fe-hydrogenase III component G